MTARESTLGPSAVAESAAEAVRTLNHLTLHPPSAEVPGWEDVSDVYRVLGELRLLVERVPQVLRQVAKHIEQSASSYQVDAAALGPAAEMIAAAVLGLRCAQEPLSDAGELIGAAQSVAAHLYMPVPVDASASTTGG